MFKKDIPALSSSDSITENQNKTWKKQHYLIVWKFTFWVDTGGRHVNFPILKRQVPVSVGPIGLCIVNPTIHGAEDALYSLGLQFPNILATSWMKYDLNKYLDIIRFFKIVHELVVALPWTNGPSHVQISLGLLKSWNYTISTNSTQRGTWKISTLYLTQWHSFTKTKPDLTWVYLPDEVKLNFGKLLAAVKVLSCNFKLAT